MCLLLNSCHLGELRKPIFKDIVDVSVANGYDDLLDLFVFPEKVIPDAQLKIEDRLKYLEAATQISFSKNKIDFSFVCLKKMCDLYEKTEKKESVSDFPQLLDNNFGFVEKNLYLLPRLQPLLQLDSFRDLVKNNKLRIAAELNKYLSDDPSGKESELWTLIKLAQEKSSLPLNEVSEKLFKSKSEQDLEKLQKLVIRANNLGLIEARINQIKSEIEFSKINPAYMKTPTCKQTQDSLKALLDNLSK